MHVRASGGKGEAWQSGNAERLKSEFLRSWFLVLRALCFVLCARFRARRSWFLVGSAELIAVNKQGKRRDGSFCKQGQEWRVASRERTDGGRS